MRSIIWRAPHAACAGLLALTLVACGDAPTAPISAPAFALGLPGGASGTTLDVGQTIQLTANLRSPGKKPRTVTWSSQSPAVATVTASGLVTAVGGGSTVIVASNGASSESATITVNAPAVAPPAPPAPPADTTPTPAPAPSPAPPPPAPPTTGSFSLTVPLAVTRFDGGSGEVVVANAIPLAPGVLRPGQEPNVHVFVGGQEVPVHVKRTAGVRGDGSLRSVLVQFRVVLGSAPVAGTFAVGAPREAAFVVETPMTGWQAMPAAVALPSDAAYLVGTGIVGATETVAQTSALGGSYARYDADFRQWADFQWTSNGSGWLENYYDRTLIYFAMWARTANPEYFRRGAIHAYNYRKDYIEASNYGPTPHWSQMEGLQKHYLLTGDELSRYAVASVAENLWGYVTPAGGGAAAWDQRINSRALGAQLWAWEIDGAAVYALSKAPQTYTARLDEHVRQLLAWQGTNGSYNGGDFWCGGQANFMVGLLNDALVKVHDNYRQDSRIVTLVQRSTDYLWNTQWMPAAQGFQYMNVTCRSEVGGTAPAADLNGLIASAFGWVYRRSGDVRYRDAGEQVFAATVSHAYLIGSKQFNEAYTSSWRYLGWR